MAEKQTNKQRLKEITDSIEANIQELFQSERYMNYLRTMSRFHKYSFNNTMLIHMQKPDATLVTGYSKWEQKFNRHVKRGEKGIRIIAPTPFKKKIEQEKLDPDTKLPLRDKDGNIIMEEKEIKIPMFKPVVVFDVSQTEGEPLPTLSSDLRGDVKHFEIFMEALRRSSPVPMALKAISGDMDGFFNLDDQSITIREGMSEVQTICAAVHEITHAKLHNIKDNLKLDDKEEYDEIELFGKPALFSNGRVDRDKLPEGLYAYDLRGGDDDPGAPVTVENRVVVNHAGSVILSEPLDFGEADYLALGEDMNFTGGEATLKHFYEQTHPEKVKKDRNTEEVEAESVSFAVCCYYGIETGENSFGYIASWSDGMELKELRASLETINRTADGLITDIDRNFTEICKERGIDLSNEQVGASVLPGDSVGGGETREAQPDEQFYRVNEAQYLYIQRCDTGYDYTFYDAASKRALDGGQLDNPGLSIAEAAKAVCELNETLIDDMAVVAGELPEEFTEPAPRDYHAELADHFSKEDERLWDTDTKLDEYPIPCCPAAVWSRRNTLSMRIFSAYSTGIPLRRWRSWEQRSAPSIRRCCGRSRSPSNSLSARKARKGQSSMKNSLTYTRSGDYLIPDLKLSETPEGSLGKYGRMRKKYLQENRPGLYSRLLLSTTLQAHLLEIEQAARNRLEQMLPALAQEAGATESLKASDPMKWVGLMNTCKAQAEEIILSELIYS